MHQMLNQHYDQDHPGYSQTSFLLDSLRQLTEEKAKTPIGQIPSASIYFYSFIRSSLLSEQDTRKLFSLTTLLLFLLRDSARVGDQRLTPLVQSDDQVEERVFELLLRRKDKLSHRASLEVEVGLLFVAVLRTKAASSWRDFTRSKRRLEWLFKLAAHNKKTLRKNSLGFLKQLLRTARNAQSSSLDHTSKPRII